jgi:N-acylneuraminate cytidylyltransferase
MTIAIIPARSGSKRIKNKNLKYFNGKPLIEYALQSAIQSGVFDEIYVSSDSNEILKFAQVYGVKAIKRNQELSDDFSTISEVMHNVVKQLDLPNSDLSICCILPSNPFIDSDNLKECISLIKHWEFIFPIIELEKSIERSIKRDADGKTHMLDPRHEFTRTQDLNKLYSDAGQFYWSRASAWLGKKSIFNSRSFGLILKKYSSIDIDTEQDWKLAELIYKNKTL